MPQTPVLLGQEPAPRWEAYDDNGNVIATWSEVGPTSEERIRAYAKHYWPGKRLVRVTWTKRTEEKGTA